MRVHLVGIGGAGQSALAHLYLERGDTVSGSDASASAVTEALVAGGARIAIGHDAANLQEAELVVISTAIGEENPELRAARERGLRVILRGRAAAEIAAPYRQVAIAGTHGKTTTTTMTATALEHLDPLVLNGGRLPGSTFNSRGGNGAVAVIEADESDGSFLELEPEVGVVTNIEADHLDHYRDLGEIRLAFEHFADRISSTLVACVDDEGARRLLQAAPGDVVSYGFDSAEVRGSDYRPDAGGCTFRLASSWGVAEVVLPVPGRHNARNAMAAVAAGLSLDQPLDVLVAALATVALPGRRMELVAEVNGARVYDDYSHHPTEVAAAVSAAREMGPSRVVVAFQPHMYTRVHNFRDAFADALLLADDVVLLPVYAARDAPIPGADSASLAAAIRARDPHKPVTLLDGVDALPGHLRATARAGDIVICMGAGDINRASRELAGAAA